ncbi:MAG: 16S rRNA (adenine(1518)-N(6)/adenine(1519)-N(6))-dimethyltransferase RsmA [Campylobacterales bacterium]|nr:16S rRNA (adenine(1518)-N(6)/adenine(1519)-N(6))-dimethyltransferase RsmA [Campylobacterales bacterium]
MIKTDLAKFAQKKFGQNFLKDQSYIEKIIQSMPNDKNRVVEIGPGLGDLTKELVKTKRVIAFEVDKRLCEHIAKTFEHEIEKKILMLNCGDVLALWGDTNLLDEKYHLVANLPYYIATHIILKALRDTQCLSILVMVQKEVAQKFSAKTQTRDFSSLGVLTDSVAKAKICFEVPPQAFVPPPKVTSAVLLIEKSSSLSDTKFEEFLKFAFMQPRKKLISNLSKFAPKDVVLKVFDAFELKNDIRPHEMSTKSYHQLYYKLKEYL